MNRKRWLTKLKMLTILRYILIISVIIIAIFPVIWVLLGSFKTDRDLSKIPPLIFFSPVLANYAAILKLKFLFFLKNSAIITFVTVSLSLIIGVPAAFGLSRFNFKGKNLTMFFIVSVRFVPYIIIGIPLFLIMYQFNITNSYLKVVLATILINLPFILWIMKSFFDSIPKYIDEAAALEGASNFRIFWQIILPCSLPGLTTVSILSIIFAWNEYLFALILSGRDAQTVTVGLTSFLQSPEAGARWGMLSAWSIAICVPVIILALVLNKYLRKGFGNLGIEI